MIWSEEEDLLLVDYLQTEGIERERIAQKLLPKITQQAEIILKNYFVGYLLKHDVPVLIKEATSHFFTIAHHFNPDYGKQFSFVQSRMKWYFMNYFDKYSVTVERYETVDVVPETGSTRQPFFDVYSESDIITGGTIQHVKKITKAKEERPKAFKQQIPILRHLLSLLEDDVERTYERLLVDLYEPFRKEVMINVFRKRLTAIGFRFPKFDTILLGVYTDTEGNIGSEGRKVKYA